MEHKFSGFEAPIALVVAGVVGFVLGTFLVRASLKRLRSTKSRPYEPPFDIVNEDSEESFPASDPPALALGR
jgi:hypothetical protein